MKVELEKNIIRIELDAPWEQEIVDWIWATYGPNSLKNYIAKWLETKRIGRVHTEVIQEVGRRESDLSRSDGNRR